MNNLKSPSGLIFSVLLLIGPMTLGQTERGLLSEIQLSQSEDENNSKALKSEVMITRTENKAIESLQKVLRTKIGTHTEPDLWFRLAELYMRRSKTERFLQLSLNSGSQTISDQTAKNKPRTNAVERAIKIYTKIENEFPSFNKMDYVIFNKAFAQQHLGQNQEAEKTYSKLLNSFSGSQLTPDTILALGEMNYNKKEFSTALHYFEQLIRYPKNPVYNYGMYKIAWTYYNLGDNKNAIHKLVDVIRANNSNSETNVKNDKHNLRLEALRDLPLFVEDTMPASQVFDFFKSVADEKELGEVVLNMTKLLESHSRHKELNQFLLDFKNQRPSDPFIVKALLSLVRVNEAIKSRPTALLFLTEATELCKKESDWSMLQSPETLQSSCVDLLHQERLHLAQKWLDIWTKNKSNKDFTELTEKICKLIIDASDNENTDFKTQYAYAELLFQIGKFEEATDNYLKSSRKCNDDPILCHDAAYASLYSKEKSIEKEPTDKKKIEQKKLALFYLEKYPLGTYQSEIKFKLAHIFYDESNYDETLKWLKSILMDRITSSVKIKPQAEDLMLDIYNLKKEYVNLKGLAEKILEKSTESSRKAEMRKIIEETEFAQVQEFVKNTPGNLAAEKLMEFSKKHYNSQMSTLSIIQAISVYVQNQKPIEAANLTLDNMSKIESDPQYLSMMNDAVKTFINVGQFSKASQALLSLANKDKKNRSSHLESAGDIFKLEKESKEAHLAYSNALNSMTVFKLETETRIFGKMLENFKNSEEITELNKIKEQILKKGLEPYSTKILISNSLNLYSEGKTQAAFDLSLKANGRPSSPETRAGARLLQAMILEKELLNQSVKSTESRFSLVLGIKTEKLDKATTAYSSALKMSEDPELQIKSLIGLERCFSNYIDSIENMPVPPSLSTQEQKELRYELDKVISPIKKKRIETQKKITSLIAFTSNHLTTDEIKSITLDFISIEKTIEPIVLFPLPAKINPYFPLSLDDAKREKFQSNLIVENDFKNLCQKNKVRDTFNENNQISTTTLKVAQGCFQSKQYETLNLLGSEIVKDNSNRDLGLFYLSLAAEGKNQIEKAELLIDLALKIKPLSATYIFQKMRLTYLSHNLLSTLKFFEDIKDSMIPSPDYFNFAARKAFLDQDYVRTINLLSVFNESQIFIQNLGIFYSEALAQQNEISKAIKIIEDNIKTQKEEKFKSYLFNEDVKYNIVSLLLQLGRIYEFYKFSPETASTVYERALKEGPSLGQKNWIIRKIEILKNQSKVSLNVTPGDYLKWRH